eukprot:1919789-Rhodomonas_salina.1
MGRVEQVAVASYLLYVPQFFPDLDLGRWANIAAYAERCANREAYEEAYGAAVAKLVRARCAAYVASAKGRPDGESKSFWPF